MTELIRTPRDGCFTLQTNSWGSYLARCNDPTANATLEDKALESFELRDDIIPIPSDIWARWVKLCFHFVNKVKSTTEVSCRLLRHEDDKSQWRLLVPVQDVDMASVRIDSFDSAIDIVTGEEVSEYPPPGWVPCGSSHSHNTMQLDRFSATDDTYELGDPGLHIVISHINTAQMRYRPTASITANKRRFYLPDASAVIDLTPRSDIDFHPDVLNAVKIERPVRTATAWTPWQWNRGVTMPDDGSDAPLFVNPNAGNGYQRLGNSRSSAFDSDAPWRWGWGEGYYDDDDIKDVAEVEEPPTPTETLDDVETLVHECITECLMKNDTAGLQELLDGLIDLTQTIESFSDDPTSFDSSDEEPDSSLSTAGTDRTPAGRLHTGDW